MSRRSGNIAYILFCHYLSWTFQPSILTYERYAVNTIWMANVSALMGVIALALFATRYLLNGFISQLVSLNSKDMMTVGLVAFCFCMLLVRTLCFLGLFLLLELRILHSNFSQNQTFLNFLSTHLSCYKPCSVTHIRKQIMPPIISSFFSPSQTISPPIVSRSASCYESCHVSWTFSLRFWPDVWAVHTL